MRILVLTIGFLIVSSAATLAAEKVVLPEGELLICTKRAVTHMNYNRVDNFGHPLIITSAKDDMKKEYEHWLKKRHKMDVVSTYTFTTSENNDTVLAGGFFNQNSNHNSAVFFTKIDDNEYVPKDEFDHNAPLYSAYLIFYKNDNDHYFAYTTTSNFSWVDMCVLHEN